MGGDEEGRARKGDERLNPFMPPIANIHRQKVPCTAQSDDIIDRTE